MCQASKAAEFLRLLALGELRVYLNPKAPGVVCPERFKREPYIVLRYGEDMMTGLEVTADGVMATLGMLRRAKARAERAPGRPHLALVS